MKKLTAILILISLVSCSDIQNSPKPDDYYGDDKMADMMTDLYLMEASMTSDRGAFTQLEMLPNDYIFKKYDTDSVVFKENLFYYSDRIEKYDRIMDMVQERLDILKDSVAVRQERQSLPEDQDLRNIDTLLINDEVDPDNLK